MSTYITCALLLLAVAGIVTSQERELCPLLVTGGSLAVAATCTSVLSATLNQLNQNCADQIQLVNKECNERIETLNSRLVTGEDCCRDVESLSQDIKMLKTKIETDSDNFSALQRKVCELLFMIDRNDVESTNVCLKCIDIFNMAECDATPRCRFDLRTGLCHPSFPSGK